MHSSIATEIDSSVTGPHIEGGAYHLGRAWYSLIVFELLGLASGIDIAIVTLLVHPIEMSFRINDVGFAAITAVPVGLGIVAAYYPAGLLADAFRRRDIIAAGSVLWGLAAFVAARADSETMFFFARLLAGFGTGVLGPPTFSILTDAFPRTSRALAISVYSAAASIGSGIGFTICGAMVVATEHRGTMRLSGMILSPWQQCFIACAAMGLVSLALVFTVPEPARRERAAQMQTDLKATLGIFVQYLRRNWRLWTLLLSAYSIGVTSCYAIGAWAPAFGLRHFGAGGVGSIALLGFFNAGGSLLGSITGGLIAQRAINHGHSGILPRVLVADMVISCVFVTAFPFMPSWLLAVSAVGGLYVAATSVWFFLQIAIQETAPNEVRGQLLGLFGVIVFIPSTLGATLVAFLASGVFAKTGNLGPAIAVVGGTTSLVGMVLYAFSSVPFERARRELRALVAQTTSSNVTPMSVASEKQ